MNYKNCLFLTSLVVFSAFSMQQPAAQQPGPQLPQAAALFTAVQNDDVQAVRKLLQETPALANSYHSDIAVLREAAQNGNTEIVQALLVADANPDPWDSYNITPLMMAALNGHPKVVTALIIAEADVNARDGGDQSVLNYVDFGSAQDNIKNEVRSILQQAGAK